MPRPDAGNVLFVLSYSWRSLPVLLAARLLNGCGSARTANRRYTADYVSKAQRTMASAGEKSRTGLPTRLGPGWRTGVVALPHQPLQPGAYNVLAAQPQGSPHSVSAER